MQKRFIVSLALALAAGGAVVLPASHADAAKKKAQQKKAPLKADTKADTKGDKAEEAAQAEEQAEERKAPAQFGWTQRSEGVDMDSRADQKRDEAIAKLKKLLPTVPEGGQKAELVFRLSEMYWAKSKFLSLKAMQVWDQALDAWAKAGNKGEQPKLERIAEYDQGELYKREALKLYDRILKEYPDYPRKDEVLYNLGSSLYESGDKQKGVEMYWTLIKQFPKSDFAPDAWLQLGEHFFTSNKVTQAVKAYSEAAKTEKPRIYSFALYKLAWCDYNLSEYEKALDKFKQVIAYAKKTKAGDASRGEIAEHDRVQLMGEAMSDMIRTYSHLDDIEGPFDFYTTELGAEKSYKYLRKLASLYNDEGKHEQEVRTYEELNKRYPYAPEAPSNQTAIMNAYAAMGKNDLVRREVRRLIDLYSPNGVWAQKNSSNQRVLDSAFEVVEEELATLVTEQHRAAQQTKLVDTYKLARDIYKEYLDKFTQSENTYKFRFFYAEILFELKQFEEAAEQYSGVVASNPKGEFVKPAAYTAILAYEKVASGVKEELGKKIEEGRRGKQKGALEQLGRIEELEKGKKYEQTPLSDAELKLAAACDKFVQVAVEDDEVVKVKFKSARLYFIHNNFEEAATRFGEIIDRWPKDSLARIGAESILQSFAVRENWTELNKWSRKFDANKVLMAEKTFAQKVDEFVEGSSFNEVHFVYEPTAKPLEIAERYAAFVKEFPKSKYVMVGLYNTIVNYDKANLLEKSMLWAEKTLSDYKTFTISAEDIEKSKKEGAQLPSPEYIREQVLFLDASFYERIAEFGKAADLYEQFAKEFPKSQKKPDALFNAGLFREGLGELDKAIANYDVYIKEFPKKDDVPSLAWRIGLIVLDKKKDYPAAMKVFESYGKTYGGRDQAMALCADYKVVQALLKQGKDKDAKAGYEGLIKGYAKLSAADKQKPCPLEAVATAAFKTMEPDFDGYMAIKLEGSEKDMKNKLLKKLDVIKDLQKRYTDVLALGEGNFGIAALYRIGVVYQDLAQQIFATPCPKKLDEDQCAIYQAALQEQAFPLEEKAIEAYDKALKKAYELGIYNDWLAKTQDALKAYEPQRFPELHENELIASESVLEVPQIVTTLASQGGN
jgi:TolA-binding protein